MLRNVFAKTLYDQRKMFMWWSVALLGVSLVYVAGYKQYADTGMMDVQLPEFMSALMGTMDYTSAVGYLNSTFFTLIGSLLVVIFSLTIGARGIAGEEESGMLDVLLAHPVSRTRFALERFAALTTATGLFGVVSWAAVSMGSWLAEMGIPLGNIAAACTGLAFMGLVMGSVAFAVGASTGRVSVALGVTSGVALASFLVNNLAPVFDGLDAVQKLSPFYYYLSGDPLREGLDAGGLAVLTFTALVFAGLAIWGFNRRDVVV